MENNQFRPELLAPAGSLEKLKVAVLYGADAVYIGGQNFGLRAAAENFTEDQIVEGVQFAHQKNVKVYVVLNGFLHDKDLLSLPNFLKFLESQKVDAVIVSDIGVVKTVLENCTIPVHLSTQASCLNVAAAKFWKEMGVSRIVLGREVSIYDASKIKKEVDIEVEMFIHGSMCMAYSGNCVISNFTQGRDSNRGGCAHSCRFEYSLDFEGTEKKEVGKVSSFFMSSKDLNGIKSLPEFFAHEIDSLKVEGRMKSSHYAGTISKVYSEAINSIASGQKLNENILLSWHKELEKVVHRDYTEASLHVPAGNQSIYNKREHEDSPYKVVGVIGEVNNDYALIQVRASFDLGDELEFLPFHGLAREIKFDELKNAFNENITKTKPGILVRVPYIEGMEEFNIVRKRNYVL